MCHFVNTTNCVYNPYLVSYTHVAVFSDITHKGQVGGHRLYAVVLVVVGVLKVSREVCFGIVGMAGVSVKDGLVRLLKMDSITRGINVSLNNNKLTLDFHVIVSYGVSILAVSDNLISNVKYKVEEFTGIEIEKINIFVEGVRVID